SARALWNPFPGGAMTSPTSVMMSWSFSCGPMKYSTGQSPTPWRARCDVKKLKVMTVVGTRPEIIRLSRIIPKLDLHADHVLVHTGQSYDYELSEIFFKDLGLRAPDRFLEAAGSNGAETIAKVILAVDAVLAEMTPDAMLILGDTNSCMAAIPAKRR